MGQVKRDADSATPTVGAVAPTPADVEAGGGVATAARIDQAGPALTSPPVKGPPLKGANGLGTPTGRSPELTDAPPTPPRPPLRRPPEPPRSPQPHPPAAPGAPTSGTGGVTATVSALKPKGMRARIRAVKPRNLAIMGAVAAAVVAAVAVVAALLVVQGPPDEHPAEYAFDSDAVHSITDGMTSTVSPGDTTPGGDTNSLWNYSTTPTPGGTTSSGTNKYTPPYRGGGSSHFIPYSPPSGSGSGGPATGDSGGDTSGGAAAVMAAGSYGYAASGSVPLAFWGKAASVPQSVTGTVTSVAGCSVLGIGAAGVTLTSTYCLSGGAITAGERSRALQNGRLALTCPGALVPAGAQGGQSFEISCTATAGSLSEPMTGKVALADSGSAWVATTTVGATNGDAWVEHVTIDKASGNVVGLQSVVKFAFLAYQESTAFTLQ